MSHYYGDLKAAFHGKAEDLRKLAPLVWSNSELNELQKQLSVPSELAPEDEATITVSLFCDVFCYELPCIEFLSNKCPNVEIAVAARIAHSITDIQVPCSTFYPLGRSVYDEAEEGSEEYTYDAMDYVSPLDPDLWIGVLLTGSDGSEYEFDLTQDGLLPPDCGFDLNDPETQDVIQQLLEFGEPEDLAEFMAPFAPLLVKCSPNSGDVTLVPGDTSAFGDDRAAALATLLPGVSIRVEEQDDACFYLDDQDNEYVFLDDCLAESLHVMKKTDKWFAGFANQPEWLREWASRL